MTAEDVRHTILAKVESMLDHRFGYAPKDEGWVLALIELEDFVSDLETGPEEEK